MDRAFRRLAPARSRPGGSSRRDRGSRRTARGDHLGASNGRRRSGGERRGVHASVPLRARRGALPRPRPGSRKLADSVPPDLGRAGSQSGRGAGSRSDADGRRSIPRELPLDRRAHRGRLPSGADAAPGSAPQPGGDPDHGDGDRRRHRRLGVARQGRGGGTAPAGHDRDDRGRQWRSGPQGAPGAASGDGRRARQRAGGRALRAATAGRPSGVGGVAVAGPVPPPGG